MIRQIAILIGSICILVIPTSANDLSNSLLGLKSECSDYDKALLCVQLVDSKAIKLNMPVSVLDDLLNDGRKTTIKPAPEITNTVFYFGPQSRWYLNYACDHSGKLISYLISNSNPKTRPISKSKFQRQNILSAYKKANSEIDRISVCIKAMRDHVVYTHMPISEVREIFGTAGEEEELTGTKKFRRTIYFTGDRKGWRLCLECEGDIVRSYYLTNLPKVPV